MGLFGNSLSASNAESPIGAIGGKIQKWTDPIAWLPGGLGDKWVNLTSHQIPKMTNEAISPVTKLGGKIDYAINPVRRIPAVNNVMNVAEAKPADSVGLALGGYFAAPAVGGALGAGSGGGAAGAGAGTAGITAAPGAVIGGDALGSFAGLGSSVGGASLGGGAGLGALGSGTFDTTAAYASPLTEGLGTGTAGTGMGASGLETGTLGASSAASPLLSSSQAQLLSKALGNMGQNKQSQMPNVQLAAAQGQGPQSLIAPGTTIPTVNPAYRQQMAQMLMRGQ